jgi:hypothetical protein
MKQPCYPSPVNVERTIQFILKAQARAEMRSEKADLRIRKRETRTDKMEKRLDKRMDAIAKLLHQGMQLLVRTEATLDELRRLRRNWPQHRKKRIVR